MVLSSNPACTCDNLTIACVNGNLHTSEGLIKSSMRGVREFESRTEQICLWHTYNCMSLSVLCLRLRYTSISNEGQEKLNNKITYFMELIFGACPVAFADAPNNKKQLVLTY